MKLIITSLILAGALLASSFSTRYDVNVGIFGNVGYADVSIIEDENTYEIKLVAILTGTAAALTNKRVETYISKGKIKEGRYIPQSFIKMKKTNRDEKILTFDFDHTKKEIRLLENKSKWVEETNFDPIAFKLVKKDVEVRSSKESALESFIDQDILSSYLNTRENCNAQNKEHTLLAIGARNDNKDVSLSFLDAVQRQEIASSFSNDVGNIYKLNVQSIKKDEKPVDVLIALDNDGHIKEAVLGSVFWIGEISAKRVYHQVSLK